MPGEQALECLPERFGPLRRGIEPRENQRTAALWTQIEQFPSLEKEAAGKQCAPFLGARPVAEAGDAIRLLFQPVEPRSQALFGLDGGQAIAQRPAIRLKENQRHPGRKTRSERGTGPGHPAAHHHPREEAQGHPAIGPTLNENAEGRAIQLYGARGSGEIERALHGGTSSSPSGFGRESCVSSAAAARAVRAKSAAACLRRRLSIRARSLS